MNRTDFESSDPASTLADLQETWETTGSGTGLNRTDAFLLSPKNRTRPSKIVKRNYREWWSRWAGSLQGRDDDGGPYSIKTILTWLMTMSSSGYRPLRLAASIACFNILRGCCLACAGLAKDLDQATKLAKSKSLAQAPEHVDALGARLAATERTMQMIFDAVFVQRFRDVEPAIREEALEALTGWIETYPEVFLDNSYLRYLGWALSDRTGGVRERALDLFSQLYGVGAQREGMLTFKERFLGRIVEMASRDVERSVREAACQLLVLVHRFEDEPEEFRGRLTFAVDLIRYQQPIGKEALNVIKMLIFPGGLPSSGDSADVAPFWESSSFIAAAAMVKWMAHLLEGVPPERHVICVEHFVAWAKRDLTMLKDVTVWMQMVQLLLGKASKHKDGDGDDDDEGADGGFMMPPELTRIPALSVTFLLLEASARYGVVFINTVVEAETGVVDRQLSPEGISRIHSRDLATALAPVLPAWSKALGAARTREGRGLGALFDLLGLADAEELLGRWPDAIDSLAHISISQAEDGRALVRLLSYWFAAGVPGAREFLERLAREDARSLAASGRQAASRIRWDSNNLLMAAARLVALPREILGTAEVRESLTILMDLISKATVYVQQHQPQRHAAKTIRSICQSLVPDLLRTLLAIDEEAALMVLSQPEMYQEPYLASTALALLVRARPVKTSPFIGERTKVAILAILRSLATAEEGRLVGGLFDLGRLYLVGAFPVDDHEPMVAIWRNFMAEGVGYKCFAALWAALVARSGGDVALTVARLILMEHLAVEGRGRIDEDESVDEDGTEEEQAKRKTKGAVMVDMAKTALLVKLLAGGIKDNVETSPAAAVQFHQSLLEAAQRTGHLDRLNVLATPFASLLGANLASEQVAAVRRAIESSLEGDDSPSGCRDYIRALERTISASKRSAAARQRRAANATGVASRLREEITSLASGSDSEMPPASHLMTPVREMEGLRMATSALSSEIGHTGEDHHYESTMSIDRDDNPMSGPPPSSPLPPTRKRTVRL